ncbi:MAG: glycosyltransferase family 2 protein [Chloroflexota bacterium]
MKSDTKVSVIIPAYNRADTVPQTLQSLLEQTFPEWEAIVVDDGSTDQTAAIIAAFARQDKRIRAVGQSNQGGSAARNTGIALARSPWLLFLDADDWILPHHLQRMLARRESDETLDAVHCGWTRVSPSGAIGPEKYAPDVPDMFDLFACRCVFQPNACLVRRSLAKAVGGFEISLRSCQDWDFWQRISRTGARFGAVREPLARHRSRPGSVSLDGLQLAKDGLHVITQGHSPDARVSNPLPRHRHGRAAEHLSSARLQFISWPSGLLLGRERDARPLLQHLHGDRDPDLSPSLVADYIFEAALLSAGLSPEEWPHLWLRVQQYVVAFLQVLELQTGAPDLAQQAQRALEGLIVNAVEKQPITIGHTRSIALELTLPATGAASIAADGTPLPGVEQLHYRLCLDGAALGTLLLPVSSGGISSSTLRDAIARDYAWPILGHFFTRTLYPQLEIREDNDASSLWRGSLCLVDNLPPRAEIVWPQLHDNIGWHLFLQEVWSRPEWPEERFYDADFAEPPVERQLHVDDELTVNLAEPLPGLITTSPELRVSLRIGRAILGPAHVTTTPGHVTPQQLRVALTTFAGFDLCRLVVQEALVGKSLSEPKTLLERLGESAVAPRT